MLSRNEVWVQGRVLAIRLQVHGAGLSSHGRDGCRSLSHPVGQLGVDDHDMSNDFINNKNNGSKLNTD